MKAKQPTQKESKSQERGVLRVASERQPVPEIDGMVERMEQPARFRPMPPHPIDRNLRQAAILQMQRRHGNAFVRRWLNEKGRRQTDSRPLPVQPFVHPLAQHNNRESRGRANGLAISTGAVQVQRFISSEHQALGDVTGEVIPTGSLFEESPELTYGQIVALSGDFYGSYEDLANENFILADGREQPDSRERKIQEINDLLNLLRIEEDLIAEHRREAVAGGESPHGFTPEGLDTGFVTDPSSSEEVPGFEVATEGRFGQLALNNFDHFSEGGANLTAWKNGHKEALQEAFMAGFNQNAEALILAMARNAASNHYLTDAFASGHMRVPRRCADEYYRRLMVGMVDGLVEELVNFFPERFNFTIPLSQVEGLLPDWVPDLPDLPDYEVDIPLPLQSWARELSAPLADKLRPAMNGIIGQAIGGLVSFWLHNLDNERGLCVTNDAGGAWQAFGDKFLDQPGTGNACGANTTNRAEAGKAVQADVQEIHDIYAAGQEAATTDAHTGGMSPQIYFGFDQPRGDGDVSAIDGAGLASLDVLAAYLQTVDGVFVSLQGWADSRGSEDYNVKLSNRRISAVRTYLESQGVSAEQFGAGIPHGEPLAPTNTDNHQQFRRVDVAVEGTPTSRDRDDQNGELPPDIPLPAVIEGPYAAESFVPHVESNNPPLEPYEWCDITDESLKGQVSGKGREMVGGLLSGKATQFLYAHLTDLGPYEIEIPWPSVEQRRIGIGPIGGNVPVPTLGSRTIEIPHLPIRRWAADTITPKINSAVEHVVTDSVFNGIMDGACTLAESAPEVEDGGQCGTGS